MKIITNSVSQVIRVALCALIRLKIESHAHRVSESRGKCYQRIVTTSINIMILHPKPKPIQLDLVSENYKISLTQQLPHTDKLLPHTSDASERLIKPPSLPSLHCSVCLQEFQYRFDNISLPGTF